MVSGRSLKCNAISAVYDLSALRFKSHCQRKPGGAKRLGSADFLYFFSIKNQADKINFGDINKISRLFTLEIDHPPCFWPREALKTTKNNGNFSGLKQFFLKELVHRFFSEAKVP